MATSTLIHKYADTLTAMEEEALHNHLEAKKAFQQKQEARKKADDELKVLKDTMKEKHRGFWGVAKAIMGMIYKCPENADEITQALEPIIGYQEALEAVPAAEEACMKAEEAERLANSELYMANDVRCTIAKLFHFGK